MVPPDSSRSSAVLEWNLPDAADDPLALLPLPINGPLPYAPYPGLRRFTAADAPVFFGRGRSIRRFYERLVSPLASPVVLSFHGHLDYVEEAFEGLLNQDRCHVVIHLIADASPVDASGFLQHCSKHCDVRTYRNRENTGQFQSFNNIIRHFETPLCAVQDADDISLPHRLWWAGQMLHYSYADAFGATVELFGGEHVIRPIFTSSEPRIPVRRAKIRRSFFPLRGRHGYFLENPTALFCVDMFRMLGGFADFGDRLMNRASIDSELQQRLLFLWHTLRHFARGRREVSRSFGVCHTG